MNVNQAQSLINFNSTQINLIESEINALREKMSHFWNKADKANPETADDFDLFNYYKSKFHEAVKLKTLLAANQSILKKYRSGYKLRPAIKHLRA